MFPRGLAAERKIEMILRSQVSGSWATDRSKSCGKRLLENFKFAVDRRFAQAYIAELHCKALCPQRNTDL